MERLFHKTIKITLPVLVFSLIILQSFFSFSDTNSTTQIIVADGNVICFELPKTISLEHKETAIGKLIQRTNHPTWKRDMEKGTTVPFFLGYKTL